MMMFMCICFGSAVHQKAINYAAFYVNSSCANFWLNNECKNPHSRVRLLSLSHFLASQALPYLKIVEMHKHENEIND